MALKDAALDEDKILTRRDYGRKRVFGWGIATTIDGTDYWDMRYTIMTDVTETWYWTALTKDAAEAKRAEIENSSIAEHPNVSANVVEENRIVGSYGVEYTETSSTRSVERELVARE